MAESDNQLELKKRARRRLVGSVALALTAVIVLPMVMDHEPKPLTQDIQIRIPSQDATNAPKPVGNRPAAPDSDSSKPKSSPAPAPAPEPDAPKSAQKPAESEALKPQEPPPAKPDPKPVLKPEPRPDATPEPKAESKDGGKSERQAMVEAILSGNESPQPTGQFIVQLGAFGDPANAVKVRTRVKAAGFNSYTEIVKGSKGKQTRVRAGPFGTREAAEQAAAKLKRAGLAGVVAPK